jgi:hypothetical protein
MSDIAIVKLLDEYWNNKDGLRVLHECHHKTHASSQNRAAVSMIKQNCDNTSRK